MIGFSFSPDLKALERRVGEVARRQLPFAAAMALTATAKAAVVAERDALRAALDRPEPFTLRGIVAVPARKDKPVAWVAILPLQARYLAPSIVGGPQVLSTGGVGRAVLKPVNLRLDRYGNIPAGWLAAVRGRPDIFIGDVTFASGQRVSGVWQLPPGQHAGARSSRGIVGGRRKGWKLLARFADPATLPARYRWGEATRRVAKAVFPVELRRQLGRAQATAR